MVIIKLFLLLFLVFNTAEYPLNKKGVPSSKGIELYVKDNEEKFISEYQTLVKDTLIDIYISVDDLSQYNDSTGEALGYCYASKNSSEIIITNEEKFLAYEVSMLSKYKKHNTYSNAFVKGTIFHELTHSYFRQIAMEMKMNDMYVCPAYFNFSMIPVNSFGAQFIEEGICMYVSIKEGEVLLGKDYFPKNINDITNSKNNYSIMYLYSAEYVKSFLDYYGIKKGIQELIKIKPPTIDEILYPSKYFEKFKS